MESTTGMGRLGDETAARASDASTSETAWETDSEPGAAGGDEGRASTAGMRHRADYDRKELQVAQGSDGAALPPGCRSLAAQTHSSAATAVR
jgi:hypothetical protein